MTDESPVIRITAEHARHLQASAKDLVEQLPEEVPYDPDDEKPTNVKGLNKNYYEANKRRQKVLEMMRAGHPLQEGLDAAGMSRQAYERNRSRFRKWAAAIDTARIRQRAEHGVETLMPGEFGHRYFGADPAWFQQLFINELHATPPGNILVSIWPPEHGKTTTFENHANEQLALNPNYRITVASEGIHIARKILRRVKDRMEPFGPAPAYVARYGPFAPQTGTSRKVSQPWGADYFDVYKKANHDERDYSMQALGWKSSIVSTRCDQLHFDDLQSTKTLTQTDIIEDWFRQDALSRPGEHGITTGAGTRVGDDDFLERLINDDELHAAGIIKILIFPAIIVDPDTGEERPLWPERYSLDQLARQKIKVKDEAWDRNYMQNPGASKKGKGTFSTEDLERCKRPEHSLEHHPSQGALVYVGLDPALGGKNCVLAAEITEDNRLLIRKIRERSGLTRNEEIMAELRSVVRWCNETGMVTDVVIESKNFQQGLSRDERLEEMRREYGFIVGEHLTGINKYADDIGVASMATSFVKQEILLPWAPDAMTRREIGELIKQLQKWKPGVKGTALRQDRVMALWFLWILWRNRWKGQATRRQQNGLHRPGLPWKPTESGLVLPRGVR
jgi:hypothetical protein